MKRVLIAALLLATGQASAVENSGVTQDNLPNFFEALKDRMTFPLAYDGGDPAVWRERVLPQVSSLILPYGATRPYQTEVIDEVDRGAYIAQRIAFNITDESRVTALLLTPNGEFPRR